MGLEETSRDLVECAKREVVETSHQKIHRKCTCITSVAQYTQYCPKIMLPTIKVFNSKSSYKLKWFEKNMSFCDTLKSTPPPQFVLSEEKLDILMDRYLQKSTVPKKMLPLFTIGCLWAVSRNKDNYTYLNNFTFMTGNLYSNLEIFKMGTTILKKLKQVPMSAADRHKTAFTTPMGLFQFMVMPFGLSGAPATFQRMMDQILSGLQFSAAYLDDLVVFNDTWEEHLKHLRNILERLKSQLRPTLLILQTDASDRGVAAVLSQTEQDEEHPIAYFSKKLLPREQKYSTIEKECLAIKLGMQAFRVYLLG